MENNPLIIKIEKHDSSEHFVGLVEGEKYRGIVVQGKNVPDCLEALADSIRVFELHTGKTIA